MIQDSSLLTVLAAGRLYQRRDLRTRVLLPNAVPSSLAQRAVAVEHSAELAEVRVATAAAKEQDCKQP